MPDRTAGHASSKLRRWFLGTLQAFQEQPDFIRRQFETLPALQAGGQHERPVTDAHQAAYRDADRFEHAPHFTVTAFSQHHTVPVIDALAALIGNHIELRNTILQALSDPRPERLLAPLAIRPARHQRLTVSTLRLMSAAISGTIQRG